MVTPRPILLTYDFIYYQCCVNDELSDYNVTKQTFKLCILYLLDVKNTVVSCPFTFSHFLQKHSESTRFFNEFIYVVGNIHIMW